MAKPKLRPTSGYALIEPVKVDKKTPSGIVLPDTHDEKSQKGKVVAVGAPQVTDSGKLKKPEFKVGDMVLYKKWGGTEVKIEGEDFLFVKFDDILAVEK